MKQNNRKKMQKTIFDIKKKLKNHILNKTNTIDTSVENFISLEHLMLLFIH